MSGHAQIARRAGILLLHYLMDSARKQHIHVSSRGKLIGQASVILNWRSERSLTSPFRLQQVGSSPQKEAQSENQTIGPRSRQIPERVDFWLCDLTPRRVVLTDGSGSRRDRLQKTVGSSRARCKQRVALFKSLGNNSRLFSSFLACASRKKSFTELNGKTLSMLSIGHTGRERLEP